MRELRRLVPTEVGGSASSAVSDRITELLQTQVDLEPPCRIGTYLAVDGELDPTPIKSSLEDQGWAFYLPVVKADHAMDFRRWNKTSELIPNRFGILEPAPSAETISPLELQVVIVPCVAVDRLGTRIGMGGGYYDRAFAARPGRRPLLIAAVFEMQLLEALPSRQWDVAADIVVTEEQVIDNR